MAVSNYEQMKKQMQLHFLDFDQESMIRRFDLEHDEAFLYMKFVGRMYRVNRKTGLVEWSEDGFATAVEGNYNEAMSIYDVLCCSKEGCRLSGNFVSVNNLPGIVASATAGSGMFNDTARYFDGKLEKLCAACEHLGGRTVPQGDAGFELDVFDFLPVVFRFWESDEDFPASLSLLWDYNLLDYIHYETSYFIAGHLMSRLRTMMETEETL